MWTKIIMRPFWVVFKQCDKWKAHWWWYEFWIWRDDIIVWFFWKMKNETLNIKSGILVLTWGRRDWGLSSSLNAWRARGSSSGSFDEVDDERPLLGQPRHLHDGIRGAARQSIVQHFRAMESGRGCGINEAVTSRRGNWRIRANAQSLVKRLIKEKQS